MIKTSVIIPVYNTRPYLEECIDSIFAQTQAEIEVIVINDGSTDDSLEELHRIAAKYPEMILLDQENQGLSCTRNNGMKAAKGEYVFFCDSDDRLYDIHALEECYEYAKRYKLDLVMFDAMIYGEIDEISGNPYDRSRIIESPYKPFSGEEFIKHYFRKAYSPSACLVYTRLDFLKKNRIDFLPYVYYEDNLFYCRTLLEAKSVLYIPKAFYGRQCREGSITRSSFDMAHMGDMLTIAREIEALECNGIIKDILHEKALELMKRAYELADENHLTENADAVRMICDAANNICNVTHYRDSDFLCQILRLSGKRNADIDKKKEENIYRLFEKLKFADEDIIIGIYGIGRYVERLLDEYEKRFGEIRADIIFIETNTEMSGNFFKGRKVYNIRDIMGMNLEYILIASSIHEQDMFRTLAQLYGTTFPVLKLYSDLFF